MKTKEVTLPPLFSCWVGNPLAAGGPSRESRAQGRASQDRLTWEGCRTGYSKQGRPGGV